jgi:hypothetical protein
MPGTGAEGGARKDPGTWWGGGLRRGLGRVEGGKEEGRDGTLPVRRVWGSPGRVFLAA